MSLQGDMSFVEMESKIKRRVYKQNEEVDRISNLPSCVLLNIMQFLNTKEAVRTSVLSKSWKDMWKYVPTLITKRKDFQNPKHLKEFLSRFYQQRDDSTSLHSISIDFCGYVHPKIWTKVISYGISHSVENLRVESFIHGNYKKNMTFFHSISFCHSLKYLDLSLHKFGYIEFPETLDLPELLKCCLKYVTFTSSDDKNIVEPFSRCKKLSHLVLNNCDLQRGKEKVLCVSGEKLANLTMGFGKFFGGPIKVKISAPKLKSFTYAGELTSRNNPLFEHNLEFLEEATVEVWYRDLIPQTTETLKNWLQSISNVHSLVLCLETLEVLSSIPNFPEIEPICFGNLRSLIVKHFPPEVNIPIGALGYLLQQSPLQEARIILAIPAYEEYRLKVLDTRRH